MAKTSQEIEKEFIDGLGSTTGKALSDWMLAIENSKINKRNEIIKWLKVKHNFGHMHAGLLTGVFFNNGNPVYASEQKLLDDLFEKFRNMRPLFEYLQDKILSWDSAVEFVVKKTYISITGKREFSAVNIKKDELRLGLDLGDMPFDGIVLKAKLTGPMPRISHMVLINDKSDINNRLFQLLDTANKRVNH